MERFTLDYATLLTAELKLCFQIDLVIDKGGIEIGRGICYRSKKYSKGNKKTDKY